MADRCFWHSALLYLYRPNLINKRLIGAKIIKTWHCSQQNLDLILSIFIGSTIAQLKNSILIDCNSLKPENLLDQLLNQLSNSSVIVLRKLFRKQSLKSLAECSEKKIQYDCMILLPLLNTFAELPLDLDDSVDDESEEFSDSAHLRIRKDDIAFTLKFDGTSANAPSVTLGYLFESPGEKSLNSNHWLESVFKPKFERWLLKGIESNQTTSTSFEGSIRNVSVERYCQNFFDLKQKYVRALMDIWCKVEKTDPVKFIYEDIAIAAYLITLWQEEMEKFSFSQRQTFADIGCGNGLLVYILTNEGYNGYGVDVRRRNIWSVYGNNINLIEMRIDLFAPNSIDGDFNLPKCDWLIGNHSDELTPWIVYMAASASPFTKAFILPCCCYDFDGFKFQRNAVTSNNKSQYQCYIDFLQQLCAQFGFECFRDKLRIPSTKRICLVCYGRTYNNDLEKTEQQLISMETDWKLKRKQIVQKSLSNTRLGIGGDVAKVRLRDKEEAVRNCSRIEQKIKEQIINRLASALLQKESTSNEKTEQHGDNNCISFQEAIHLLDDDLRKHLKNQCGGLQTFVRNHKHIFTIVPDGICFQSVEYFLEQQQRTNNKQRSEPQEKTRTTTKTKECWFHTNHPRGCPLSFMANNSQSDDDFCPYKHL